MTNTLEKTLPAKDDAPASPSTGAPLAAVYFDNQRVSLKGDPKPLVSKIVVAAGKSVDVKVLRGQAAQDTRGTPLAPTDVVDRTEAPTKAIWLTSGPSDPSKAKAAQSDVDKPAPAFAVVDTEMPEPRGPLAPDAEHGPEGGPALPDPVQPSRGGPAPPAR